MNTEVRAVLFDMDGVLLDSERVWRKYEKETFSAVGIDELPESIKGKIYGISMKDEYALLKTAINLRVTFEEYVANYDRFSERVYSESALATNLEETLTRLKEEGLKLAVISASLRPWISLALKRLNRQDYFDQIISIADTPDLKQKPAPDGYLRAMSVFDIKPDEAIVVEDSNRGIQSGKASGALTLASAEFVDPNIYEQKGFDAKIQKLEEILNFV